MRIFRILLIAFAAIVSIFGIFWLVSVVFESNYIRLQHKSSVYYAELAAACDSILANHPLATNEVIWISVKDGSLPKIVRDLHPVKIQVNAQRVWILLDNDSRAGIGLGWQPKWGDTNTWKLDIVAESLETVIYSTNKSAQTDVATKL